MSGLLSTAEAARRLGLSRRQVQVLAKAGRLKTMRIGRDYLIAPEDLARLERRPVGRPPKGKGR